MNKVWLPRAIWLACAVAVIAVLATLGTSQPAGVGAASFNPTGTVALADSAPGANSDITMTFDIPAPDSNFGGFPISFVPKQFGIAKDADIADGTMVGELTALATLGLLNSPCSQQLNVKFDLQDATTNPAKQTTFEDGFKYGSDQLPAAVTAYPDFLTRVFPGLTPISRLYGQTKVSGVNVSINTLIFEPGGTVQDRVLDPVLGYPAVTVLQDLGDPIIQPAPNAITSFCTPLKSKTVYFGVTKDNPLTAVHEGGTPYRTNPTQAAVYRFVSWAQSQRDADNDGIETAMDTCPFTANVGDPRVLGSGDADHDGIDAACDPNDNLGENNNDYDQDGYLNRGDNCPLVANGIGQKDVPGVGNQRDTDHDGIGDACDILGAPIKFPDGTTGQGLGPNAPDGQFTALCRDASVTVGAGGATVPAVDPQAVLPCNPQAALTTTSGAATPPPSGAAGAPASSGTGGGAATTGVGGALGGPSSGIGSLSPTPASVPLWGALAAALGGVGALGALGWLLKERRRVFKR